MSLRARLRLLRWTPRLSALGRSCCMAAWATFFAWLVWAFDLGFAPQSLGALLLLVLAKGLFPWLPMGPTCRAIGHASGGLIRHLR